MKQILLVLMETYRRQVKSWSFILLVISPFIFIFISFGFGYLSSTLGESSSDQIAIVSTNKKIAKQLRYDKDEMTLKYHSQKSAQNALKKEKIKGYLVVNQKNSQLSAKYVGKEKLSITQKTHFQQVLQVNQQNLNVLEAQLTSGQLKALARQAILEQQVSKKGESDETIKTISFTITIFLMYFILITYTTTVAQDIASEKGTKIMEMVFSSMPAQRYFYGKILGTFAVIATHLLIYLVGGGAMYLILPKMEISKKMFAEYNTMIGKVVSNLLSVNLIYVLLGVIIFTILAALCGALVVRPEDTSKAVQPVLYVVLVGFIGSLVFGQNANNIIVKVASFIPFISSFFMPMRLIYSDVSFIQVGLSLLVLLAATFGLAIYVGRLYSGLILQTDDVGIINSFKRASKIK
ncbi:ABC transporter permease [Liquorilactobacillus mali]|uniref:ABC transporter, permease n=1 Tax=Liquorilactobacillus mali TaxID=1618 RepID=A0A0R2FN92_9LACO|nr:ABC transporter permease [Liquorilactobacillus mali]KRN29976.1 ABC transporter, permease [Liquorilactobacillus mali]